MPRFSRRKALQTVCGFVSLSLAGCTNSTTPNGTNTPGLASTPTETPGDTTSATRSPPRVELGEPATLADGSSLLVSAPTVQNSILADVDVFLRVVEFDGIQFVVVSIRASDSIVPSNFALERDGDVQTPPKQRQFVHAVLRECESTCIAIPFSTGETTDAAVVYKPPDSDVQAAWRLPSELVRLFGSEPSLRLQSAELVDENGELGIRFIVHNDGPRDAGFRAIVSPSDLSDTTDPVGFPVPEGETVTKTVTTLNTRDMDPSRAVFTHEVGPDTRVFETTTISEDYKRATDRALSAEEEYITEQLENAACVNQWGLTDYGDWGKEATVINQSGDGFYVEVTHPYWYFTSEAEADIGSEATYRVSGDEVNRLSGTKVSPC